MLGVMLRRRGLSRMLWAAIGATSLGSCGRVGFGDDGGALSIASSLQLTIECGVVPASAALEVQNPGEVTVQITDFDATGGFGLDDTLPIEIAPGASVRLAVRPPTAVIGTDRSGVARTGALTLVTSAGPYSVDLTADVMGANLDLTDTAGMPVTLTFSGPACPAPITARIVNSGNRAVTLEQIAPTAFRYTGFASGELFLAAGASANISVRPFTMSACTTSETLHFTVTGSVCTTTPIVLAASFDLTGSTTCVCT